MLLHFLLGCTFEIYFGLCSIGQKGYFASAIIVRVFVNIWMNNTLILVATTNVILDNLE